MSYISYSIIQPFYRYIQYYAYNVVPGVITLTFDSPPSTNPADYSAILLGGILSAPLLLGFSTVDNSLVFNGNSVSLTCPVVAEFNSYLQFSYQGSKLPFHIRAAEDYRFTQPAIFKGIAYNI